MRANAIVFCLLTLRTRPAILTGCSSSSLPAESEFAMSVSWRTSGGVCGLSASFWLWSRRRCRPLGRIRMRFALVSRCVERGRGAFVRRSGDGKARHSITRATECPAVTPKNCAESGTALMKYSRRRAPTRDRPGTAETIFRIGLVARSYDLQ